jgi:hypothetical protein
MTVRLPLAAKTALRRFAWIVLLLYATISIGLWAASLIPPIRMGPVTAYTIEMSLGISIWVGALYTMALALRPNRREVVSSPP